MKSALEVTDVRFRHASPAEYSARPDLAGYVDFLLGGFLEVRGLMVVRASGGDLGIRLPGEVEPEGAYEVTAVLAGDEVRDELERQVRARLLERRKPHRPRPGGAMPRRGVPRTKTPLSRHVKLPRRSRRPRGESGGGQGPGGKDG